jgi:ureidoacrylate peracid hydrolase
MIMATSLSELVDPAATAVIVVDMQNDFIHPEGSNAKAGSDTSAGIAMAPRLQKLLDAARAVGTAVIFIQCIHTDETDSDAWVGRGNGRSMKTCREGTWGIEFYGVAPVGDEPVVIKHRYSAFIGTRLDSVLRTFKTKNLIMTGVGTNVCVESTARDGFMLDYNIVFTSDCTAAGKPSLHEGTLENMRRHFGTVASSDEIMAAWAALPAPVAV